MTTTTTELNTLILARYAAIQHAIMSAERAVHEFNNQVMPVLAQIDDSLANGEDFTEFSAFNECASQIASSMQAAIERLTEAGAHAAKVLQHFNHYAEQAENDTDEN